MSGIVGIGYGTLYAMIDESFWKVCIYCLIPGGAVSNGLSLTPFPVYKVFNMLVLVRLTIQGTFGNVLLEFRGIYHRII